MVYKIGDKVRVIANEYVDSLNLPFHHYELGEIVRVIKVTENLIECKNSKGIRQSLRHTHIKPIKIIRI